MATMTPASAGSGTPSALVDDSGTMVSLADGSGSLSAAAAESVSGPMYPSETLYPRETLYPVNETRGFFAATASSGTLIPA